VADGGLSEGFTGIITRIPAHHFEKGRSHGREKKEEVLIPVNQKEKKRQDNESQNDTGANEER
jgi:hypothetical protein